MQIDEPYDPNAELAEARRRVALSVCWNCGAKLTPGVRCDNPECAKAMDADEPYDRDARGDR